MQFETHCSICRDANRAPGSDRSRPLQNTGGACLGGAVAWQAVAVGLRLLALLVPLLQGFLVLRVAPVHLALPHDTGRRQALQHASAEGLLPMDGHTVYRYMIPVQQW